MVREAGQGVEMMQRSMLPTLRLAMTALQNGQFAEARDAAAPWTAHPSGALLHAIARAGAGDVSGGAAALAQIARANPAARHPVQDLIDLLQRHDRSEDTVTHLRAALEHRPRDPSLLILLGRALAEHGPMAEATEIFRAAAEHAPANPVALSNWGKCLAADRRFDEAEQAFAAATRLSPADPQLTLNRAVSMLKSGRWREGWPLFRVRHSLPGRPVQLPGPELTEWNQVCGRTILLAHSEGFGDTLQFIRYARLLAEGGATVLISVPVPLVRLFQSMAGLRVITGALPPYDAWCRISDLPAVFGTTPANIPGPTPYLAPDPALVTHWAARLPRGRRVGVVWAGAARPDDPAAAATDRIRSIPRRLLSPLLSTPGITWINLQQDQSPPAGIFDPMPAVTDFADTAAIIASLEAVISVDTAVAHLTAAIGKPVILLDRYDNCWRWLSGCADSPWYPGLVRILRQPSPGDWVSVLDQAVRLLTMPGMATFSRPADTA